MQIAFALFIAGLLTILLPCILPLVPIVLGVSVTDRNPLRPLVVIAGMLISFVGSTFLLSVLLNSFVELADYIRIATYAALLLFGIGFATEQKGLRYGVAALSGFFFFGKGWIAVVIAAVIGVWMMSIGGWVATRIQQFGTDVQQETRTKLGTQSLLAAFLIGLTMGFVWVPCAGPALGFAFALVRDEPGLKAFLYLTSYGIGAGIPLLLIGYGGQLAVHSVRALTKYTGLIKKVSGILLIATALALQFNLFVEAQIWLEEHTGYSSFGAKIEEKLFHSSSSVPSATSSSTMQSTLPTLSRAPLDMPGLGPWHNSSPLTAADLKGKVVLVDFWTYSCINCIRTLPHIQAYWEKFKDAKLPDGSPAFVLLGVHTPEFTFEKSEKNVAMAITEHGLTYPTAQDNDFATWNAFANRYWPAKYLIDANGYIRYEHFGEGNYEETDKAIASLLREAGAVMNDASSSIMSEESRTVRGPITAETYLHSRSWPAFGNAQSDPSPEVISYGAPKDMQNDHYYLVGNWQLVDDERQVLRSNEGEIRIRARGGEINLVLGPEEGVKPVQADIFVDGTKTKTITIDHHDLYELYKGPYGTHNVTLVIHGNGIGGYAFTFGG